MVVVYKIEDYKVDKNTFVNFHPDIDIFKLWENVIADNESMIEKSQAAIIFKLIGGKFKVVTDTVLLIILTFEVNKLAFEHKAQPDISLLISG
ncbi:MAG TPA: hypothetical protein VN721_05270 [Flavipsychrobacter sp.]|nr:hypothetical protein [Flavipsychrobacter sp.]